MSETPAGDIFLGFQTEKKVMELAQKHARTVCIMLKRLREAIALKLEGADKDSEKVTKEISKLESDADKLGRTMLRDLTQSPLESADRENLVRLAKALDRVADWANDSARILPILPLFETSSEFKSLLLEFTQLLLDIGKGLNTATKAIVDDLEKAKKIGEAIEEAERKADELYTIGLSHLLELGKTHSAAVIVLFRDLLHNLENTADTAEDAVDQLRIIILRRS